MSEGASDSTGNCTALTLSAEDRFATPLTFSEWHDGLGIGGGGAIGAGGGGGPKPSARCLEMLRLRGLHVHRAWERLHPLVPERHNFSMGHLIIACGEW